MICDQQYDVRICPKLGVHGTPIFWEYPGVREATAIETKGLELSNVFKCSLTKKCQLNRL